MIFVPQKEKCSLWNQSDNDIFIVYNYNDAIKICFYWKKYKGKFEPFSLEIKSIEIESIKLNIFNCTQPSCQAYPQLRYNDIMKKWYVCCPSSMICTKDNDESEIELFKCIELIEKNGFYDDPINAILHWQKQINNNTNILIQQFETLFNRSLHNV